MRSELERESHSSCAITPTSESSSSSELLASVYSSGLYSSSSNCLDASFIKYAIIFPKSSGILLKVRNASQNLVKPSPSSSSMLEYFSAKNFTTVGSSSVLQMCLDSSSLKFSRITSNTSLIGMSSNKSKSACSLIVVI